MGSMFINNGRDIPTDGKDCANILLLGKTGAGKSSFINYFFNKDVAEASAGEPVTQELFHRYEFDNGKFPIMIYDTKGLETNTAEEQVDKIISEIRATNNSNNIFNWFHTIFYVVSMSTARFEPYERELIRKLSENISQHIHIILTHCDTVDEQTVEEMRSKILREVGENDNVKIFPVVSIEKKKRNGTVSCRRGKEEIEESVFSLLWSDICARISKRYAAEAHKESVQFVMEFFDELVKIIDDFLKLFNLVRFLSDDSKYKEKVESKIDDMMQEFEGRVIKINKKYNEILAPVRQMFESYKGFVIDDYAAYNDLDFCLDPFDGEEFLDIDEMEKSVVPNISKLEFVDVDNVSVWEMLGSVFGACGDILSLRKNVKRYLRDEKESFLKKVPSEGEMQKTAYEKMIASVNNHCFIQ